MSNYYKELGVESLPGISENPAPMFHEHPLFVDYYEIPLTANWKNSVADEPLRVQKSADFVVLEGTVEKISSIVVTSLHVGTVPPGWEPEVEHHFIWSPVTGHFYVTTLGQIILRQNFVGNHTGSLQAVLHGVTWRSR